MPISGPDVVPGSERPDFRACVCAPREIGGSGKTRNLCAALATPGKPRHAADAAPTFAVRGACESMSGNFIRDAARFETEVI
jgi:hypothetical protein